MQRRDYLALVGAAAATAGCPQSNGNGGLGGLGGGLGGGSLPDYADWLGEPNAGVVSDAHGFLSVALSPLVSGAETATATATPTGTETGPRDALVVNPAVGLLAVAFLGFGLAGAGLSRLVAFDEAESPDDLPVERVTIADATVLHGSFDPDAVAGDVEGAGLTETGTAGDFTVYAAETESGDATEVTAVAASSDFVIYDQATRDEEDFADPRDVVDRAIGLHVGDEQRLHEGDDDRRWLLQTAGRGDVVLGVFATGERIEPASDASEGPQGRYVPDLFRDAAGVVQHLDVPSDGSGPGAATAAFVYPEVEDVDTDRLRSIAGQDAADRSVRTDGARVVVDASYESSG